MSAREVGVNGIVGGERRSLASMVAGDVLGAGGGEGEF